MFYKRFQNIFPCFLLLFSDFLIIFFPGRYYPVLSNYFYGLGGFSSFDLPIGSLRLFKLLTLALVIFAVLLNSGLIFKISKKEKSDMFRVYLIIFFFLGFGWLLSLFVL